MDYEYNSLGQLQKVPGFVDEAPVYDQGGMLKSLKAANGISASYDYDQNGRLVGLNYTNQAATLKAYSLKYDETNNIVKKNNDTFQYDLLNQLLYANLKGNFEIDKEEETQKVDKTRSDFKGQKTFEFELNQPDVIELDYAAGSIGVDLLAPVKVTKITLQPNSPIHRVTKFTSIRLYISQDNITYTRLKDWKMAAKEKGKFEIVLDTAVTARYIKVKSMFDERDSELNPVNQAQFVNVPQDLIHVYYLMNMRQEEYSYDKIGNRLTETVTQRYPVSRTYSYYENSSRLKSNGKYIFEYDANGNLVKKETLIGEKVIWKYEYDLFNRLLKVTKNDGVVAEYIYDEAGLRIKKQGVNSTTYYTFDTGGNVLYEQENREYMEYIYVLGKHFARVDGNLDNLSETTKYFYHTDHLGSTVLVTDEAGQQVWSSEYIPFGKQVSKEGEMDHVTQFTGKDLDEDTGLYYFNARWYDQETGRFISEDQVNDPNNPNLYVYVANNPLTLTDSTGNNIDYNAEMMQANDYENYWNQENYFTDNWILDSTKQEAARTALQSEINANGKIVLPGETNSNKIAALQYLAGALDTGEYTSATTDVIQTIQTKYNIMGSKPYEVDQQTFSAILDRYDKGLVGKSSGDAIKRMGVGYIFHDAAYVLLAATATSGSKYKTETTVKTPSEAKIPQKAYDVADEVLSKNGASPQGYKGGRVFQNDARGGSQKLPGGVSYKEYDVNPYVKGQNRGTERIVIGSDGSVWYTNDHYNTFTRIK